MIYRFCLLLLLFSLAFSVQAQNIKRANVWYFGRNAGLDFNTNPPTPKTDSQLNIWEGCATICDENGQILLYTDGRTIWNKNHEIIPGATNLGGHDSATQSGLIVPQPGSDHIYYVFSVYFSGGGLQYSIIDVKADNYHGRVLQKNIKLLERSSEKVTTVRHCNGRDIWIIGHEFRNSRFHSWLLTPNGLSINETSSDVGSSHTSALGYFKSSPDGSKLAVTLFDKRIELLHFNNKTGEITNPLLFSLKDNRFGNAYGIEFSPNGQFLYLAGLFADPILYQVELTSNKADEILKTLTLINKGKSSYYGALQNGPDGRIYVAKNGAASLSVITNPNLKGLACGFQEDAISLGGKRSGIGLPNLIPNAFNKQFNIDITQQKDSCGSVFLQAKTDLATSATYQWYRDRQLLPGDTSNTLLAKQSGNYEVSIVPKDECQAQEQRQTTAVNIAPVPRPTLTVNGKVNFCQGESVLLSTNSDSSGQIIWQRNGLEIARDSQQIRVTEAGMYTVALLKKCDVQSTSDSALVTVRPTPTFSLGKDTTLCEGISLNLSPGIKGGTYVWQDGSGNEAFSVTKPGTYSVEISSQGCSARDTIAINYVPIPSIRLGPDTTVCQGETFLLTPQLTAGNTTLLWDDGSTQLTRSISGSGTFWAQTQVAGCINSDTIQISVVKCSNLVYIPDAFSPNGDQNNDVFLPILDREATIESYQLTIYNRWGNVVFQSDTISHGWDGSANNAPLPTGIYTYRLQLGYRRQSVRQELVKSGPLSLLR